MKINTRVGVFILTVKYVLPNKAVFVLISFKINKSVCMHVYSAD